MTEGEKRIWAAAFVAAIVDGMYLSESISSAHGAVMRARRVREEIFVRAQGGVPSDADLMTLEALS